MAACSGVGKNGYENAYYLNIQITFDDHSRTTMFRSRSPPLALCVAEQLLVVLVVGFVVLWPRHVEFIVRIVVVVKATECRQRGSKRKNYGDADWSG